MDNKNMIEQDLEKIRIIAEKKSQENKRFIKYLKSAKKTLKRIDSTVIKLYDQVVAEIDCLQCANCCKILGSEMHDSEIKKISKEVGIDIRLFKNDYLKKTENGSKWVFKKLPCPMLDGNSCQCYNVRPKVCEHYPHLDQFGFLNNISTTFKNYAVCPIVFNVIERLKIELYK